MEGLPDWFADNLMGLERSDFGEAIRMTPNLYPILMSVHVIGIALLLGSALIVDLRLLGVARHVVPVTVVARYLLPVAHVGFSIVVLTGLSMFSGIAVSVASNSAAPWKFGLIAVAGLNIAVFHCGIYRSVSQWDLHAASPLRANITALVSASSWAGVVFAGRFLAY